MCLLLVPVLLALIGGWIYLGGWLATTLASTDATTLSAAAWSVALAHLAVVTIAVAMIRARREGRAATIPAVALVASTCALSSWCAGITVSASLAVAAAGAAATVALSGIMRRRARARP